MAAADFQQEEFDDKFLTCDICKEIFEDPRILPCHQQHTFCSRCLERRQEGSQFTCPICQHQVELGRAGVSSLPPNLYVKKLLDFRALHNSKKARASCGMCDSAASVEGTCGDCQLLLCGKCLIAHENTRALRGHSFITLDDLKNPSRRSQYTRAEYCPRHSNERLAFYCRPCAKLVCRHCKEHRGRNHNPQEVSTVAQTFKTELQTLLQNPKDNAKILKKTGSMVNKELSSITTNCDIEETKIQEHFAQQREELDRMEKEMREKLRDMERSQKEPLLQEKEELEKTLRSTEEGLKSCTDVLGRDNDVEIITRRQQLGARLENLAQYQIQQHRPLEYHDQVSFLIQPANIISHCDVTLICKPVVFTELPTESLPTTVIYYKSQTRQFQGTPQVTVTSPGGQCARLDTTETSEGVFEAVWRPQTSGKHEVGVTTGGGTTGGRDEVRLSSPVTVDVRSNDPVLRFGQKGSEQGQFDWPIDVAVMGDRLYVADFWNSRVQVFDLIGKFCCSFSTSTNPASVAVQTDGTIVVQGGYEVKRFSSSGALQHKFRLGEYCTDPHGLAVQCDGKVVVADRGKHSISLFKADGALVKQVGGRGNGEGQFDKPYVVCVDKEDNIIVADRHNHRVQVFDKNLKFQHKFGQKGRQPQDMWAPRGVSADSRGNIVLANIGGDDGIRHSRKLQVFRPDGTWVSTISSDGDKLKVPCGLAVTEDGHVFVADPENHCIRKYRYI
ncbi:PREDICTED: E3 ubiquitin-protein ligase TRIM71-like [Branchiostoma belcheri]|uniref:E3 ubiquitin-protein ligase TRIM71-like n=1 Tax=Branchiostoma belcheri TaxID=7741 RepID=A0A6P5APN3_BRABE|nr:PREDICTED: E3 ubiquitin-protein ligase TRIM71-like [Branchiostoma belcheri]